MTIRNFLFHRVSTVPDALWPPMHPSLFEKIIRFLAGNFSVVSLEDLLDQPLLYKKEKSIATISFDDGYRDNVEVAAPILQRYRCPASFYLVTACIDQNLPTWTYIADHIFQQEGKRQILLESDFVPASFQRMEWATEEEGRQWGKQVKPWMKTLSNPERLQIMEALQKQHNGSAIPSGMMMGWSEARQLQAAGFYIGSHSHTHPMLASLNDEEEMRYELEKSAERLEKELGNRPMTISYPIGSWDQRVIDASIRAGYKYGLAVEQRFFKRDADNLMAIPRVELYNEPWWKARLRISGLYQAVKKLAG